MSRNIKRELGSSGSSKNGEFTGEVQCNGEYDQDITARRILRSCYRSVKSLIIDEREEISRADSDKFSSIMSQLDSLHQQVQKPREQVADAETLLDITSVMLTSVQAENKNGITVSDFVSTLIRDFGQQTNGLSSSREDAGTPIAWADVGVAVPHFFRSNLGCSTMIGPMDTKLKQRKVAVSRKHVRPTKIAQPVQLGDTIAEERTDTDKNMLTMFNILRKNRRVRLENLVLNRNSFPQTVENLFTLSFLVKDGRVEIKVDDKGCHLVCKILCKCLSFSQVIFFFIIYLELSTTFSHFLAPKNAPSANAVASGEVAYHHFVFRLDFKDWKLMTSSVVVGEELMPHRNEVNTWSSCEPDQTNNEYQEITPTAPIRKLFRNRGLVSPEHSVQETSPSPSLSPSPQNESPEAICKGKHKVR